MNTPATPRVSDQFGVWLHAHVGRWSILALFFLTSHVGVLVLNNVRMFEATELTTFLVALQLTAIVVLLICGWLIKPTLDPDGFPRATIAVEQFQTAFNVLWLFWLIEFIVLTGDEATKIAIAPGGCHLPTNADVQICGAFVRTFWDTILNLANNLPTVALILCYIVLSNRTVEEFTSKGTPQWRRKALPWLPLIGLLVLVTMGDWAVRYAVIHSMIDLRFVFGWFSGFAAGTATALIVGRLDSKFIGLPTLVVIGLYVYAVIQPSWEPFQTDPVVRIWVLSTALVLKVLLFVVVYWLLKSGVLLFYLEEVGKIFDDASKKRLRMLRLAQQAMGIVGEEDVHVETTPKSLTDRRSSDKSG